MTERRTYHCRRCGRVLFETDVPLGTDGHVYAICKRRDCREYNPVGVGKPPRALPKVWTEWNMRAAVNGTVTHDPAPSH